MSDSYVVGIDPGATGAIAFLSLDGKKYWTEKLRDLTDLEAHELFEEFKPIIDLLVIEKIVGAMPKVPKSAIMKLFGSYRSLRMLAVCHRIKFNEIIPNEWMKALKCQTKGDKKVTREKAQNLFPNVKVTLDNADALLIAEYARLYQLGILKG